MTRGRIQSIVRTSLAATLAMAWTLIGIVQMPLIQAAVELERLGPQIGQRVPDFSLPDQSGATGTVVSRSFEERYQERASANSLVDRLQDGRGAAAAATSVETKHLSLTTVLSDAVAAPGTRIALRIDGRSGRTVARLTLPAT